MKPITIRDIKGPEVYAGIRSDMLGRVIALKKPRRVSVGDRVTMVFENRQTLIFQIEEMLRTEHITEPGKIQDEIDVYNQLMPTDESLSATLFIELPGDTDRRRELDRLIGLDEHVVLHIGDRAIRAHFEPGRSTADRISAVQYLRFPIDAEARRALLTPGAPLAIEIDHPAYQHRHTCSEDTRRSLAEDFAS